MIQGRIVKGIGGFYYVSTEEGVYECKARGKFRNQKITPLVGDHVYIEPIDREKRLGSIEQILPRRNELIRPTVANVDQAVIVFAAASPDPNIDLLDRFLILVEEQRLDVVICINKIDLAEESRHQQIQRIYRAIGYEVVCTSTKTMEGIEAFRRLLQNKVSVLAGPSGVGKSSLLNATEPNLHVKTGELSAKIDRGKHTTRHAELMTLEQGGYIVDSPGFTSLFLQHIPQKELQYYFIEFQPFIGQCKFTGCSHIQEPECAIKEQVEKTITLERYKRYTNIYEELRQQRRR